jgi:chemotaxis response regulator CheB
VPNNLHVARDGVEAMAFLHRESEHAGATRPDLILLDLNLPRMDGREVLAQIKSDRTLKTIPVLVPTTSRAEQDVLQSNELQANCYITQASRCGAVHHRVEIDRRLLADDRHLAASGLNSPAGVTVPVFPSPPPAARQLARRHLRWLSALIGGVIDWSSDSIQSRLSKCSSIPTIPGRLRSLVSSRLFSSRLTSPLSGIQPVLAVALTLCG